ncbi:MAG: thioredoxin-dependent thiol peroxidase [Candidatus Dojkabacteria bacterium]|nr:thioredoxin-dependent thiol peroxidase [Candidatus Dojkabacteria bacterium]MDQ7020843.1 thioredoxin-dependent thiol peroxidase [Candidatus Dojkabacteria bacterium]
MLTEGDKVPTDIAIENQKDENISLSDYKGKFIVLYFYPKDDTPGCTKEACSFRDFNEDIKNLGVEVIGVSKDSIDSHDKFIEKHKLNFTILSDDKMELQKAFGVWQEKSMFGKKYMGTVRSTFIINPEGSIIKVWPDVKVNGHVEEVFEYLKSIIS